jgi:acyl-CoA thioester hydrolase
LAFQHTSTFRLRHHECDANGHLNNVNYLRYVVEASIEASGAVGYELGRLRDMNRAWHVREAFVEYLRPLTFGDTLEITASPTEVDWETALWAYDLRRGGSEEVCAQAQVAFAFVDPTTGQPAAIPEEAVEILEPGAARGRRLKRSEFPTLPPKPPGAFQLDWEVEWRDVDQDLYLRSSAYLDYLGDFVTRAAAACGRTFRTHEEEDVGWVIRRQWLGIRDSVALGDELRFTTWISDIKRVTVLRHFTVHRQDTDAPMAWAHTLWVCVDRQSGRPVRIPPAFREAFAPQISGESSRG